MAGRRTGALVLILVASGLVLLLGWPGRGEARVAIAGRAQFPIGVALVATGVLLVGVSAARRAGSSDGIRLDLFLAFLRKPKKGSTVVLSPWQRRLRRILPTTWMSDLDRARPGAIRRLLKRAGPSVLSSPVRRVVQGICLIGFLWLFLYVCWPYTARPVAPGEISDGWQFQQIDQASGQMQFVTERAMPQRMQPDQVWYLVDPQASVAGPQVLGAFRIVDRGEGQLDVAPRDGLSQVMLESILTRSGPWQWHERSPDAWPSHYADDLARKERIAAEIFLVIDPLVSLSTAIASRSWVWSLAAAGMILAVCLLIPRGFCGYLCPLGTLIDLFDWSIGRRVKRFRVAEDGWWVHIKYYVLTGTLVAALMGVLVSGYVSAIPVVTRGLLFLLDPLQIGLLRGWHLVPPLNAGHAVSLTLFAVVLGLGLLRPRFWCKYVCPSGAMFSVGNLFRLTERKVESSCIHCNKCVEICPFDAIKPDFTTRTTDCTLCQTCGGVCPTHAIKFVERWNRVELKVANEPPTGEGALGRRGFLSLAAGTAAALVGGAGLALTTRAWGARHAHGTTTLPVRPPGSVPEREFLQMCIRCGECFKACPNNVLQPLGFQQGLEGLWTPAVHADWAGCESSCNACGQVCPTGAIRALPLEEKRAARMGLAIVNLKTCLPYAGREACQLCVDECHAAGYHAIEFTQVHTKVDAEGRPIAGSGYLAPVVLPEKCVGCGLCQTRCYGINVDEKGLLAESAIIIEAGEGKEDRLMRGSYLQRREEEARRRARERQQQAHGSSEYFVPDTPDPQTGLPAELDPPVDALPDVGPSGTKTPGIDSPATDLPVESPLDEADPFGLGDP